MRNLGLDVLRCCAVLLVLGQHLNAEYLADAPLWADGCLRLWRTGGGIGVTLFFVLSGFLISGLVFDEFQRFGTVDVRRFLIRRGFKLYPPLWALLVFYVLMNVVRGVLPWEECVPRVLAEIFFMQNYFPAAHGHTWTLAVEEHFYIASAALMGFLCARQVRSPFRGIPLLWLVVAVGCALLRMRLAASSANSEWSDYRGTHLCVDAMMLGVLMSYLVHFRHLDDVMRNIPTLAVVATAGVIVCLGQSGPSPTVVGAGLAPVANYVGCGLLVLAARRLGKSSSRVLVFLGILGATSYSTYLWHGWMNMIAARGFSIAFGFSNVWAYLLVYVAGSFAVGVVMYRLIEQRAMALRNHLYPSPLMGPVGVGSSGLPAGSPNQGLIEVPKRRRRVPQGLPITATLNPSKGLPD